DGAVLDLQPAQLLPAAAGRRDQGLDGQLEAGFRASTRPRVRPDGRRADIPLRLLGLDRRSVDRPGGRKYAVGLAVGIGGRCDGGRGVLLLGLGLGVAATAPPATARRAARVE